jgi:hypothetical protein
MVRRLLAAAAAAAVIAAVIAAAYGYAGHQPEPRDVRIALAAPPAVEHTVAVALARAGDGGFTTIATSGADAAVSAVRDQRVDGALVLSGGRPPQIVTAGAAGVSQQQAIEVTLGAITTRLGASARQADVAPLPRGDRGGQSSFVFELAILIPSVLGAVAIALVGGRTRLWWRVMAAAVYAVLASLAAVLVLDGILGALTEAPAATFAFGVLGALTCVLFTIACQAMFGTPGTAIAAVLFLFVGNAMSGGTVPRSFLPDGFRQISEWLPNGAIVQLTRNANYFGSAAVGHALLVLAIWLCCAVATVAVVDVLQRSQSGHSDAVYPASALAWLARRRSARASEAGG